MRDDAETNVGHATHPADVRVIHTFACHTGDCCPQLLEDPNATPDKRFVITDDHGGSIRLSRDQLKLIVDTNLISVP